MAETYDITHESALVGTARMEKQGLYYVFSCRCRLPKEGLYRIHAINGDAREDLGICIPMDGVFGMDKKVPQKRIGEGILTFELVPKDWKPQPVVAEPEPVEPEPQPDPLEEEIEQEELFVPVAEEQPFDYLDKLENAVMEIREDTPGIILADEM
jgi:hypothetical protein